MARDMQKVVQLIVAQERLKRERARQMMDLLAGAPGLDITEGELLIVRRALQRNIEPDRNNSLWRDGYFMLSRGQIALVWDAIRALPPADRPHEVRHAFDLVLVHMAADGDEVDLTRDQMAEKMKTAPENVSRAMTVLVRMGVVERKRVALPGVRGQGIALYTVNPHVGWVGSLEARRDAAAAATPPLLTIMQGGKAEQKPAE